MGAEVYSEPSQKSKTEFLTKIYIFFICFILIWLFNSLSANPTKRSNTLKQFVSFCRRIECVWPFCGVGAKRVNSSRNIYISNSRQIFVRGIKPLRLFQ